MFDLVKKKEKKPRESILLEQIKCVNFLNTSFFSFFYYYFSSFLFLDNNDNVCTTTPPPHSHFVQYLNQTIPEKNHIRHISWDMAKCQKSKDGNVLAKLDEHARNTMKVCVSVCV